jgi:Fe-S-cluster-containing hydrogenase component 2
VTVAVDRRCTACGLCLLTCPADALSPAPGRPAVTDAACTDCWLCIEVCPVDAIEAVDAIDPVPATTARSGR